MSYQLDKYLKPIGIELTEEQMEQVTRASIRAGVDSETYAEAIVRMATVFAEAWQILREIIRDMWDQIDRIREFINNCNTTIDIRPERKGWRIPRKIIRDHQVLDRRPAMVYIRNEI